MRSRELFAAVLFTITLAGFHSPPKYALACDICAIYSAKRAADAPKGAWQLGVSERYARYEGRARGFYDEAASYRSKQSVDSSTTQIYLDYQATSLFSLQLTTPWIYREYQRVRDGLRESGDEFGLGDVSLLAHVQPYKSEEGASLFFSDLYIGVKLPTGDSDRLGEEVDDPSLDPRIAYKHSSGGGTLVGGDDLALGSGSTDALVGGSLFVEQDRFFATGEFQFALRTEGDYDFEYGDEISWAAGPGLYLLLDHPSTISLQARLSGESKATDRQDGTTLAGSGHDRVFLGPTLSFTWGEALRAELSVDLPIKRNSTAEGVEPRYRLGGTVSYWF